MLRALTTGNLKLCWFWISGTFILLTQMPSELTNKDALAKKMGNQQEFNIDVSKSLITKYNNDMIGLGADIKKLHNNRPLPFKYRLIRFFMVRLLTIIAAFSSPSPLITTFVTSLLQFMVLPYSLLISIGYGVETIIVLFTGHILVFPFIKYSVDLLFPDYLNIYIPYSPLFLLIFIILDQIICALCLYKTPKGTTKPISNRRIFESVWYGFLNCKTYYLVVIPLLFGQSFPLTAWCIDALLGISGKVSDRLFVYWQIMFYHIHRMGHLPHVYPDAHKFHHYLSDTTAFDAHIFGAGAPEEWLLIIVEVAMGYLCGMPPCLSYWVLGVSWYNKWGFHSRNTKPEYHSDNFHADHHLKHSINFGFNYPLEMVMNTTTDRVHEFDGYRIKKVELEDIIRLQFTPYKNE